MQYMQNFKKHLEKYIQVSDNEFDTIVGYFTHKSLKKNDHLIKAGDLVTQTYWVKKGLLISSFLDASGKEHIIQFAIENCWITDQNAFYNRAEATFNIICLEDTELLCLSFKKREKLCEVYKMESFFRKKANDSFVKQQKRLLTYMASDAKERFNLLLAEYPGLFQRLSKKTLAAYLGVTRETLSRFKD